MIELNGDELMPESHNTGDYNTGNRNSGDHNTGHSNVGDHNSGHGNSGRSNTGDRNSGDCNAGHGNSGNNNSGHGNSGDCNAGDCNAGYRNAGDYNAGNFNAGRWNAGDWNTGFFNTRNYNSGFFNTEATVNRRAFLDACPVWFDRASPVVMVDEIFTYRTMHEAWAAAWESIPDDEKLAEKAKVEALPGFNYEVWVEITGIDFAENENENGTDEQCLPPAEVTVEGLRYVLAPEEVEW